MLRNLFLMVTEITSLLHRDLTSCCRNVQWILFSLALVNVSSKLVLSDWNWRMRISDMKNLVESKFDYRKNWS